MGALRGVAARHRRPLVVDLYSGAGGLSLGMEQAGFDVVAAAEFDPVHALTHRANFPDTPVLYRDLGHGSVTEVSDLVLSTARDGWKQQSGGAPFPGLDAIVGGPPCQGFSVGGVRNESDERNIQLLRFVELIIDLQPKVFCLENVSGLLESRFAPLRGEVERRLADGGYAVTGFTEAVNAADFGVPQNRRRVIVTGSRIGDPPQLVGTGDLVTVGEAFAGLPDLTRYRRLLSSDEVVLRDDDLDQLLSAKSTYARRLIGVENDPQDLSRPRVHKNEVLTNSLRTVHQARTVRRFSRTAPGRVEKVSHLFRLDPTSQARTLRAGTGTDRGSHTSPRPIHPSKDRVITVREAARLHGYPDWFRFHSTNWHGHRQVGNSVPPPLAAAIGRSLVAALGKTPERPANTVAVGSPEWLRYDRTMAIAELSPPEFF